MKLSSTTLSILQNLSAINPSVYFSNEFDYHHMINQSKSVYVKANIPDTFPVDFGIYDLPEFLSTINLLKMESSQKQSHENKTDQTDQTDETEENLSTKDSFDVDFKFEENYVDVQNKKTKIRYWYASKNVINSIPEKPIVDPEPFLSFELTGDEISYLKKAAQTLSHSSVSFYNTKEDPNTVNVKIFDIMVKTANVFEMEISSVSNSSSTPPIFEYIFDVQNLKYLAKLPSYTVGLAQKGKGKLAVFQDNSNLISYFIGVDSSSTVNV